MPRDEIRREETAWEEIRREETTWEEIRRRKQLGRRFVDGTTVTKEMRQRDEKCRSGSQFDFSITKTLQPFSCRHVSPKDKKKYVS
ncbi:hypothetical protein Bca101_028497 [Brassica carinata]